MSAHAHDAGDEVGGRYLVEGFLSSGGMQEVYYAQDQLLRRRVALKTPKTSSAEKRFKRSAETSALINQSNVAKTLDYLEEDGNYYLIEELVDGCNLAEFLVRFIPTLDPYTCAGIFHRLAKGVAASHHANVVHRDLKPSNILVAGGRAFEEIKITDFGIAKMAEEELAKYVDGNDVGKLTSSSTALGALPYMAPEAIESLKAAEKPADIWSLGALMFELVVGRTPFGSGLKAVPAILEAKLPKPNEVVRGNLQFSSLHAELYDLVKKCMAKKPAERPTADALVSLCASLCYRSAKMEFGEIVSMQYGTNGFIRAESGESIFYHTDSSFGDAPKVGDRVWFSRYAGTPRERAFPLVVCNKFNWAAGAND